MAPNPTLLPANPWKGPQPPWWDQHRCRAEGSRGAPDVWLPSSVCPCWAAAGVTSTVLLFLARPMTQERPCGRGATYKPGREASPETNRDGAFVLDFSLQNCEKIKALQLAKQQPYPQSWAFAHTATPIPAPPALLWQPLPRMQPQGPALRRPPGLPSPHVVLLSVPATSIPAASVPAACTLSPALQGSGGQDTTGDTTEPPMAPPRQRPQVLWKDKFVAAAAPDSLQPLQQGGATRATHSMELAGALPLPSCKPATSAATQVVTADLSLPVVFQGKQAQPEQGRGWRSNRRLDDQLQRSYPLC
ncbi:uncharacterized protein LOC111549068 isoform X2 [Piliocolobus tephrosceles]|uniref:uncharacterized protein LOC111549068 isoform X2 n=1 Tax=Piliocolobus tephrosceles TaxID=591936 RepID=UPI000E6AFDE8|nr:uncharacterized protein LOC111549068 isoform X2 [Piliocolobus tephrosceles]